MCANPREHVNSRHRAGTAHKTYTSTMQERYGASHRPCSPGLVSPPPISYLPML